ncbi:hypothetical protein ACOMHN_008213 [Nucella lapillus]
MPVEGLPSTLDTMLNAALREMTLSSFKIEGRGNQTTVLLRLTTMIPIQPPVTQNHSAVYRRKSENQAKRDRRRAEEHRMDQEKKTGQCDSSPSGLFLPTPPSLFYSDNCGTEDGTDMFVYNNSPPSVTQPSANTRRDEETIDMAPCNTNTQTMTLMHDDKGMDCGVGDSMKTMMCDSDTPPVNSSGDTEFSNCVDGTQHVDSELRETRQQTAQPRDFGKEILEALEIHKKNMDSLIRTIPDASCVYLEIPDASCVYLEIPDASCVYLEIPDASCVYLEIPDASCVYLEIPDASCVYLEIPDVSCVYLEIPDASCVYLEIPEVSCVYLEIPDASCVYLEIPDASCVYLEIPDASCVYLEIPDASCVYLEIPDASCV